MANRFRRVLLVLMLVTAGALAGCSSNGPVVEEALDPETGVTVMRANPPVILYRDASYLAANARDFVYMGPIEVNRMGELRYFLWLGVWSTLDEVYAEPGRDGFESIVLFADGEPIPLDAAGWTLETLGVSDPVYVAPVGSAVDVFYHVTIDQVRLLAEANDLEIRTSAASPRNYILWATSGGMFAGLRAFVACAHQ